MVVVVGLVVLVVVLFDISADRLALCILVRVVSAVRVVVGVRLARVVVGV